MKDKNKEQQINECVIIYDYTRSLNLEKISENELIIHLYAIRYSKLILYALNRRRLITHIFITDTEMLLKELNIVSQRIEKILINKKYGE